jgi:hypothetical protein
MAIPYPAILTKAEWDKQKGILAKAKGETGVGAACEKAHEAYKAIDWTEFNIAGVLKAESAIAIRDHVNAAKLVYKESVMPTSSALMTLSSTAAKAAGTLNANALTKAAGAVALLMSSKAKEFAQLLVSHCELLQNEFIRLEGILLRQSTLQFDQIWANAKLKEKLLEQCKIDHCEENYYFLHEYGSSAPKGPKAIALYAKFIAPGAPMEINANALDKFIAAAKDKKLDPTRFDGCPWEGVRKEIRSNMTGVVQHLVKTNLLSVMA